MKRKERFCFFIVSDFRCLPTNQVKQTGDLGTSNANIRDFVDLKLRCFLSKINLALTIYSRKFANIKAKLDTVRPFTRSNSG